MTHGLADSDEVTGKLARSIVHPRRRAVLDVLEDAGDQVSLVTLCERVVAGTSSSASGRNEEETWVSLLHQDLPLLEDLGLVDVDRERGTVDPRTSIESMRELRRAGDDFVERLHRAARRVEIADA